jgi:hypothetical protein
MNAIRSDCQHLNIRVIREIRSKACLPGSNSYPRQSALIRGKLLVSRTYNDPV